MRIVTWNCCGDFHNKVKPVVDLEPAPDIAVIQEAEKIDTTGFPPDGFLWHCERPQPQAKKSIGILWRTKSVTVTFIDRRPGVRRYEAQHGGVKFHIMAVWTSPTSKRNHQDYRQLHDALHRPDVVAWIRQRPTAILGDFNTNAKNESSGWHDLKTLLDSLGLVSAYHEFTEEEFGKESRPTHFHHKNENSTFHIDYCFLPVAWVSYITKVEVGTYNEWSKDSDHVPLIVDLDL